MPTTVASGFMMLLQWLYAFGPLRPRSIWELGGGLTTGALLNELAGAGLVLGAVTGIVVGLALPASAITTRF